MIQLIKEDDAIDILSTEKCIIFDLGYFVLVTDTELYSFGLLIYFLPYDICLFK